MATTTITTYDEQGAVVEQRVIPVPQEQVNADQISLKLGQQLGTLEQAARDWANLTAAQRTAAQRLCIVIVIRLVRFVLQRFDTTGED